MSYLAVIAIIASLFTQPLTTAEANDCVRDYTKPCAEGWTESLVFTRVCEAPIFYHGPCSTNLPFVDTKEDKLRIEQTCGITWPCYSYCDIDENAKCPKFWYMEDGLCVPSAAYHGKSTDYYGVAHDNVGRCVEPADLTKMHETERTLWGNRCGVAWPCNVSLIQDGGSANAEKMYHKLPSRMPRGKGQCVAPSSYKGPCFGIADLSFFSYAMKEEFGELCDVTFPCSTLY